MTNTVVRIVLALALLFSVPVVLVLLGMVVESIAPMQQTFSIIFMIVFLVVWALGGWVLIWGRQVRWTGLRIGLTLLAVPVSAVPVLAVGGLAALAVGNIVLMIGVVYGPILWYLCWLACTAVVWRQTRGERELCRQQTICPRCRYDLRGRTEASCPECGAVWALEELYALLQYERERAGVDGQ